MTGGARPAADAPAFRLTAEALARAMPLHLVVAADGTVLSAGPTVARIFPGDTLAGLPFLALFDVRGPAPVSTMAGLAAAALQKLRLTPTGIASGLRLRGIALPLAGGDGFLVNLSFGVDIDRAVRLLQLTDADFAPTDLAMELLYLAEANAAVRNETRALSRRLVGARQQAMEQALTDPLTGLQNRRACDDALARLCRDRAGFGLLHLDLDHFKQVNDRHGHAAGDSVLQRTAAVLRSRTRASDCLARVGGDEFIAILPGLGDAARLERLGQAIVAGLAQPGRPDDGPAGVSASIGFAIVPAGAVTDPAQVLSEADRVLYAAKAAGRGRVLGTRIAG